MVQQIIKANIQTDFYRHGEEYVNRLNDPAVLSGYLSSARENHEMRESIRLSLMVDFLKTLTIEQVPHLKEGLAFTHLSQAQQQLLLRIPEYNINKQYMPGGPELSYITLPYQGGIPTPYAQFEWHGDPRDKEKMYFANGIFADNAQQNLQREIEGP